MSMWSLIDSPNLESDVKKTKKAFHVFATYRNGAVYHFCDMAAYSAGAAIRMAKQSFEWDEGRIRMLHAEPINLADMADDPFLPEMRAWMKREGVTCG